jgi:hypothetical protein
VQKPRHPVGRVHDQIVDGEAGQADADAERRDGGVLPDLKEKIKYVLEIIKRKIFENLKIKKN